MNVLTLLEMAATGMPGRVGLGRRQPGEAVSVGLTYRALLDRARSGASVLVEREAEELVYVGVNANDFAVAKTSLLPRSRTSFSNMPRSSRPPWLECPNGSEVGCVARRRRR